MPPIAPDTLLQQRYRILNMLGEGEFGRTYLATDGARTASAGRDQANEYCAIEEFIPAEQFPVAVAKAKEFFKQEAALLYQLHHPQVPRFWAIFEEQNRLFLVRDYIEGKTYRHLLEERRNLGTTFSEAEVRQFLLQILPAIGYIHSKGAIHRDIAPENIILRDRDLLPVLTNFGVVTEFASRLQADPVSQGNIVVGKPGYSSTEQLNSGQVYPNSDLYALAVTTIVLLTGKEPSALFTGNQMNWDWRKWSPISDSFANVLQRMLDRPLDRYQSAIEVDRDLQSLQIPDLQPPESIESELSHPVELPNSNRSVELPTMAVGSNQIPSNEEPISPVPTARPIPPVKSEITNLNIKSFWEKPQVFIPLGVLISLLAGLLSWFGVSQLLHRQSAEPVANTPPKQVDFNNPTIPTDRSPTVAGSEIIQPAMDRAVVKEGTVAANNPVRYRIAAIAGQNLDIQLVPIVSQNAGSTTASPPPIDGTQPSPDPTGAVAPNGLPSTPVVSPTSSPSDPNSPNSITSAPAPSANQSGATQVLMSILSPSGAPVDPQADRVVGWRGQITTPGEHTIELRPIKGLAGTAFPYKLSVTQVSIAPPAANTTPFPVSTPPPGATTPSTGGTIVPPVVIPVPIGGNGLDPNPISPNPNLPSDIPTTTPIPAPTDTPTTLPRSTSPESEPPARRRRRARVDAETSTPRRSSKRIESSNEETPTPRRRKRNRIVSNGEQTPSRSQRRNRSATADTQPKSVPNSESTNNPPKSEPSAIPINVPAPNSSPPKSEPQGIPIKVPTPNKR
jgi:serine/threonine protein kinase